MTKTSVLIFSIIFFFTACKSTENASLKDITATDSFGFTATYEVKDGKFYKTVNEEQKSRKEFLLFEQGQNIKNIQEKLLNSDSDFHANAENVYKSLSSTEYKETDYYKDLELKNDQDIKNFDATRSSLLNSYYIIQAFRGSLKRAESNDGLTKEANASFTKLIEMMESNEKHSINNFPNGNFIITMLDASISAEAFHKELGEDLLKKLTLQPQLNQKTAALKFEDYHKNKLILKTDEVRQTKTTIRESVNVFFAKSLVSVGDALNLIKKAFDSYTVNPETSK